MTDAYRLMPVAVLIFAGFSVLVASRHLGRGVQCGLLLLSLAGVWLAGVTNDLFLALVAVELAALPWAAALFIKNEARWTAGLVLRSLAQSLLAMGLLLAGGALLSWAAGSTDLARVREAFSQLATNGTQRPTRLDPSIAGDMGCVLLLGGLGIHLIAAPFQLGVAELFDRARISVSAVTVTVPRLASLIVLIRVLVQGIPRHTTTVQTVFTAVALFSIIVGGLLVSLQRHFRRLLAYTTIVQAGLILAGLAAATAARPERAERGLAEIHGGVAAACLCFGWDSVALLGLLSLVASLEHSGAPILGVDDLAERVRGDTPATAALVVLMLSLVGLPPFAGFWARVAVARSVLSVELAAEGGFLPHPNMAYVGAIIAGAGGLILLAGVFGVWIARLVVPIAGESGPKYSVQTGAFSTGGLRSVSRGIGLIAAAAVFVFGLFPAPASRLAERTSRHRRVPGSSASLKTARGQEPAPHHSPVGGR